MIHEQMNRGQQNFQSNYSPAQFRFLKAPKSYVPPPPGLTADVPFSPTHNGTVPPPPGFANGNTQDARNGAANIDPDVLLQQLRDFKAKKNRCASVGDELNNNNKTVNGQEPKVNNKNFAPSEIKTSPINKKFSDRGLNVDAPVFVPQNNSFYATPPSTPNSSLNEVNNARLTAKNDTKNEEIVDEDVVVDPNVLLQQLRDYKAAKKNGKNGVCELGGCNSTQTTMDNAEGSRSADENSCQTSSSGLEGSLESAVLPPAQFRFDRDVMLTFKDYLGDKDAPSSVRSQLSDEFIDENGVWCPDIWIKSVWKRQAEAAGAATEDEYFRSRQNVVTAPWISRPTPGFIRRTMSR